MVERRDGSSWLHDDDDGNCFPNECFASYTVTRNFLVVSFTFQLLTHWLCPVMAGVHTGVDIEVDFLSPSQGEKKLTATLVRMGPYTDTVTRK